MFGNGERRRHRRDPCLIPAEIRAGAAFMQRRPLIDISEDGAFALVPPVLALGTRAMVRFQHPRVERVVTTRAVVARRVEESATCETPGLGLFFLESLSALGAERRHDGRLPSDIPVRVSIESHEVSCRLVDLSDWGGALGIDLGLKRLGEPGGGARRVLPFVHLLRTGRRVLLRFVPPGSGRLVHMSAAIARCRRSKPALGPAPDPRCRTRRRRSRARRTWTGWQPAS